MNTENSGNLNNHRQQIKLPDPLFDNIELAFHAFENRKTTKTISDKKLPLQIISNLLWLLAVIIAGNVYLFAASQGLAAWFHNCDKQALTEKLNLGRDQRVLFGQTVGFYGRVGVN